MFDRRKHPRAVLAIPLDGVLSVSEEVLVESYASREITVVSGVPARSDQHLVIAPIGAAPTPLDVRVTESTPAVVNGVLKHRLRLRVVDGECPERPLLLGELVRQIPVRVLDMSEGGCLLETHVAVSHGTAGELQVSIDGEVRSDKLRVCRSNLVRGAGSIFRLGAEFTPFANGESVRALLPTVLARRSVAERAVGS